MQEQEEAQEQQAHHVTAEGYALPKKVWVMNTGVTPTSGTIGSGQFIDLDVTVSARDLAMHQGYELSADEMGKVVCLAEVGGSELPRGAVPSRTIPWVYEAVNPQPNRVTLRVRAYGGGGNKALCVRTRAAAPQHPGWHDSNKDNLDGSVHQVQLTAPHALIAVVPWNGNDTQYFWGDGTHSCYNPDDKVFYKDKYGFNAQGMRRNNSIPGWPENKTLAGAFQHWIGNDKYLMWNDHTHSRLSVDTSGTVTAVGQPAPNTGWTGYPTGNKTLVAASRMANYWFALFWSDGTHSVADAGGFVIFDDATRYRPNSHYGLPMTKAMCAAEYWGVENNFRVFWHDGTHSQIEGGLVTNRNDFDAQGYRDNRLLPGWTQLP